MKIVHLINNILNMISSEVNVAKKKCKESVLVLILVSFTTSFEI